MLRLGIPAVLVLAVVITACGGSDEARIEKCVTLFTEQVRGAGGEAAQDVRSAIQTLCNDAARSDAILEDGNLAADKEIALLKRNTDVCATLALAGFPGADSLGVTKTDLRSFGKRMCEVIATGEYVGADGHLDTQKLLRERPELLSPLRRGLPL